MLEVFNMENMLAQTIAGFFGVLKSITLYYAIPLIMMVTIAFFTLGIVKFISSSGDAEKRKKAKDFIIWGLVALLFMIAFWAVVVILINTFFGEGVPSPTAWPPTAF